MYRIFKRLAPAALALATAVGTLTPFATVRAVAYAVSFDEDTTLHISAISADLVIAAGSHMDTASDTIVVTEDAFTVTMTGPGQVTVRWNGPSPGRFVNDGGLDACDLTAGDNILVINGPDTVTVTPSVTVCSGGGSGMTLESTPYGYTGPYVPAEAIAESPTINVDQSLEEVVPQVNALCASNSLIKLPTDNNPATTGDSVVYYCGKDGERYVFPTLGIYKSWYPDFSGINEVPAATMSQIAIGGNVRYKPGVRMIKLQTDDKTYAIAPGGVLRWVATEAAAVRLYGSDWNSKIDDVSDAFFVDYAIGAPINE